MEPSEWVKELQVAGGWLGDDKERDLALERGRKMMPSMMMGLQRRFEARCNRGRRQKIESRRFEVRKNQSQRARGSSKFQLGLRPVQPKNKPGTSGQPL